MFQEGNIVELISGGPKMTVERVFTDASDSEIIQVIWFVPTIFSGIYSTMETNYEGGLNREKFFSNTLKLSE